ncbi:hypothetical protein [Microtetraspora fusca]|nr:hypothetical protein [Microtetraspora fusca]
MRQRVTRGTAERAGPELGVGDRGQVHDLPPAALLQAAHHE